MNSRLSWVFLLPLIVVIASCSGKSKDEKGQADAPRSAASISTGRAGAPEMPSKADAKDLGALVDVIVANAGDLPRAEFDPGALADSLGGDPQKIFEWVRDRTWWAPYRGLLRGAKGVMLDRVGSNLDRAVLLGDLMRRAGHTVRLAHTQLPENQARELFGKLRPFPDQPPSPVPSVADTPERNREIETIAPGYEKSLPAQIAETKRRSDAARVLIRSQADQLVAAVKGAAVRKVKNDDNAAIAALQDHWWVEYIEGGKWIAMDVLLPQAKVSERVAKAVLTSNWNPAKEFPAIPESNWHTVGIRIVIERYKAGATSETKVFETTIRPAEVLDRPIILAHVPSPWPEEMRFLGANPAAAKVSALAVTQWAPVLQIGRDSQAQSGFTNSGDLAPALADSAAAAMGGKVASSMDMALGISGGEASASVTAEWLDYEVKIPGEPIQQLRRPVFDLLGPARRAAKFAEFDANAEGPMLQRAAALLSQTEILLQPCDFTEAFVAHLASASIVANRAALKDLSKETDPGKARDLALTILDRMEIWGPLPNFGHWRSALSRNSAEWFIDRPNILNHRISQPLVGTETISIRRMLDVASNGIGARLGAGQNAFEVRVQQGVADTVAEMMALGSDLGAAANTASVFSRLAGANSRGFVIGAHDDAAVRQLPWPDDEAARVAADVGSGYMVYVPRQAVEINGEQHVGWWRIDPISGETIGVMDSGFHSATEDAVLVNKINALRLKLLASYLAAGGGGVAGGRGVMDLTGLLLMRMHDMIEVLSKGP